MSNVEEFVDTIFEGLNGFVYSPIKHKEDGFIQRWFLWPDERGDLISSIEDDAVYGDVYLSPVIYEAESTKAFHASNVCWVDWDYGIPESLGDFPDPSIMVSSSSKADKAHAYWKLNGSIRDPQQLEKWNKQLAYALKGDTGCWNFSRVLRPPDTKNHKYNPVRDVTLVRIEETTLDTALLAILPEVPEKASGTEWSVATHTLPSIQSLNKKYRWTHNAWDFFTTPKYDGNRHKALTSVAITCKTMGMSNDETLAYLFDADDRWKKFKGRNDRLQRLQQIVLYAEATAPVVESEAEEDDTMESGSSVNTSEEKEVDFNQPQPFSKFTKAEYEIDWVIDGLLHAKGMGIVASPPGIGKTQFSLNLAMAVALGRPFLKWDVPKPRRILFLSLEMSQPELKVYMDTLSAKLTEDERKLLDENFYVVYRPAFRLGSEANQAKLTDWLDEIKPAGIFVDSLSRCIGGDLEKGEIDLVFDYLNQVKDARNMFVWFVHHNRKANFNQKQPKKLEDLYGSQYIGAYASTVLGLWKINHDELELNCLKLWLKPAFKSFFIKRQPDLTYSCRPDKVELT